MPGYLWLALLQNLNEVTNADLTTVHQVQKSETGAVGQGGKQARQVEGSGGTGHVS
jgi:hypothetical protein